MSGEGGSFKNPANLFDRSNWGALASGLGVSPHWIKTHPKIATAAAAAAAAYFTGGASLGAMGAAGEGAGAAGAGAAGAGAAEAAGAGAGAFDAAAAGGLGMGLEAGTGAAAAAPEAGWALGAGESLGGGLGSGIYQQPGLLAQFQASPVGKGLSAFGKASKAMQVAGLLNPQQSGPPPGHAPQSYGPQPQNTILYPSQQTNLSQVGAPIGIDERDPRYLAWLAAHGRAA